MHCVKRIRIRSYSGPHFSRIFPHSDWIRRDTDQNNSDYGLLTLLYNHRLNSYWSIPLYIPSIKQLLIKQLLFMFDLDLMEVSIWECIAFTYTLEVQYIFPSRMEIFENMARLSCRLKDALSISCKCCYANFWQQIYVLQIFV